jgi:hypothetical protein
VEIFEQCTLKTTEVLQFFGGTMTGEEELVYFLFLTLYSFLLHKDRL